VYKDGTIRFDATDAPLTHFTPREIGVPISKLNELGYLEDQDGNTLTDVDQIVELRPQDIIISKNAQQYLTRVANFLDDLLEKVYGLPRFYNIKSPQDLVGHLVLGLAPHISAGIVGRIIGFTDAQVGYAHPYFHAAKRRNCDSDEDGIMFLLDALINFSRHYLPPSRGGMMDAPLILNLMTNPDEIDDEVYNLEVHAKLPLEFYEKTFEYPAAKDLLPFVDIVDKRKGSEAQFEGFKFTHGTSSINIGPMHTKYSQINKVSDKIKHQLELAKMIRAVDESDVCLRVINTHFIPDIYGNLIKFGVQSFRCTKCNEIYRRPPHSGRCDNIKNGEKCNGELLLTVYEKSIIKYLNLAQSMAEKYQLKKYLIQRLELVEDYVRSVFENDKIKKRQKKLDLFIEVKNKSIF
ncbi:MAG: DNA polymerase II large subunit, partial [Candidatus Helarchaeales archaeon]